MRNVLAVFIGSIISFQALAYECGDYPFTSTTLQDGRKLGLFFSAEDLEDARKWDINNGEPPLSISEAVAKVKAWAETYYPRFDAILVAGLRMQKFGCWDSRNNWLYVFDLTPVIDGNELHSGAYMAAVTMSGKIIEPKEIRE